MPICLNVADLQPGMKLYQPVCNEYVVLLPAGKAVDQADVDALQRRFPDLRIMVSDPLLDDLCDFQDNTREQEIGRDSQQAMSTALSRVRKKLAGRTEIRSVDIVSLHKAAQHIIEYLNRNPVTAILLEKSQNSDTYIQEHSANVFYISMIVGNAIKQYIVDERQRLSRATHLERTYAMNLTPLAMGCLLHDMGMLELADIYNSVSELTPEQRVRLENHPISGEKMLPHTLSSVSRMIVRTHHENFNGTGYPFRIPREKLHVFSRIIRIADAFDAATSPRIYKKAKSEVRVLWEMTHGPTREHYDPAIVKVFTHMVHPFHVGVKLLLSNGMTAVVVKQNPRSPFHPRVIIAYGKDGNKLAKAQLRPPIDLYAHRKQLKVVSFNGEDLTYLTTTVAVEIAAPTRPPEPTEAFNYVYP